MPLDDPPGVAVTANQRGDPEPGTAPWSDHRAGLLDWERQSRTLYVEPYELRSHPDFQNLTLGDRGQSRLRGPHARCRFQTLLHHQLQHLRAHDRALLIPSLDSGDEPAGSQSYSSFQPCAAEHRPQGQMDLTRDVESFDVLTVDHLFWGAVE